MTATSPTITRLDVAWCRVPFEGARGGSGATGVDVVVVTLADDEGAIGTGFTYALTGGAEAVVALIAATDRPLVLGTRLDGWDRTWLDLWDRTHRLGRGVALPALSAIDIAVWDLRARRADLPLHRLLGSVRDTIEVYGSGRSTNQMTLDELVAGTRSYLDEGYQAVKLRVGARRLEEDAERVAGVRDAVGDDVRLMVDCNERLDQAGALWLGRRLADLDVYWMEEPLRSDDVAGHARLASRVGVPIAVGEHLLGRFEFAAYLQAGAAAVVMPDAPLVGGVTEWLRIATLAEALGASVSPHFLPELHVHLAAAAPAATSIEHFPLIDDLLEETLVAVDGHMAPPDRPGHGIRWDAAAVDRFRIG